MFDHHIKVLRLFWKSLLKPFLSFILRNVFTILLGPWFIIVMVLATSAERFTENTVGEVTYFLNHPIGWGVIGFIPISLIASIFLLYLAIPRHLIFSAVMLGAIFPGYFAFLYLILEINPDNDCVSGITSIADAYYFSITTYTTLGYGEFTPTGWCRALTSFQALLGLFTIGVFPAIIISEIRMSETNASKKTRS